MLSLPPSVRLFVATQPVDGRKGVVGLMVIVRDVFGQDPLLCGGLLFIFFSMRRERIRSLAVVDGVGHRVATLDRLSPMAEPTLKDVLNAITKMEARLEAKIEAVRGEVEGVRADVATHRKETATGFDDLDDELAKHSERTHRKLEARIERLEKRSAPKKVSARPLRRR